MFLKRLPKVISVIMVILLLLMLFSNVITAQKVADDSTTVVAFDNKNSVGNYKQYLSENSKLDYATENVEVPLETENKIYKHSDSFKSKIDLPKDGAYLLSISYISKSTQDISFELKIDGKTPFDEAAKLQFPCYWVNETEIVNNDKGNQFTPEQVVYKETVSNFAKDYSGENEFEYLFMLTSGEHEISVVVKSGEFYLKSLAFEAPDYLSEYTAPSNKENIDVEPIVTEGESAYLKNDKALIALSDNGSSLVHPCDAVYSKLNYIGGSNWSTPGQSIYWKVNVPESGYYSLGFNYRQSYNAGSVSYRNLQIDGKTPFAEAARIKFAYNSTWEYMTFSNEKNIPYYIYLEEGERIISLSATGGEICDLYSALQDAMKVWLLDEKHFPTGFANDYLKEHPELIRKLIREEHMDVVGPQKQISLLCNVANKEEKLLYAVAYKREIENPLLGESIDLTEKIKDGLILWDVPEGFWRVFYIIETNGKIATKYVSGYYTYYIDMLSKDSCRALVDAVYEPHYERYKEYFGNTFLGFFSDEPRFGNDDNTYYSKLGKKNVVLPWSNELLSLISKEVNMSVNDIIKLLPTLWFETETGTAEMRYGYMNTITKLYQQNFSDMLGDWCREHGVMYIGHVIEDMNAHMRLGYGSGHFFRALSGQDMSGIDVVLHQIVPGFTDITHQAMIADGGIADPAFFDYTLAKLGVSAAHTDPKKHNRCMCELFGAYGWAEGLPMMKYLADHMIVNGVNYFVPHAFTPRYPNNDCPPHFYAEGKNPQFKYFKDLVTYMNRCVTMLSDGVHSADVAVLYNPEGEWCSGEYELFQGIAKLLTQNQIDFDFVSFDDLQNAKVNGGKLEINKEKYSALIISYSEILPKNILEQLIILGDVGLPIVFSNNFPKSDFECFSMEEMNSSFKIVAEKEIPLWIESQGYNHLNFSNANSHLRFYHISKENEQVIMLFNDSCFETVNTQLTVPFDKECVLYDAWTGETIKANIVEGKTTVEILPQSTTFLVFRDRNEILKDYLTLDYTYNLNCEYDIYIHDTYSNVKREYAKNSHLFNISSPEHLPHFCGEINYKTYFNLEYSRGQKIILDLGVVGETAEVFVNGENCGLRIQYPYVFDITASVKEGKNMLEIFVTNNPAYYERDVFSSKLALPPSGLIGPIKIAIYN